MRRADRTGTKMGGRAVSMAAGGWASVDSRGIVDRAIATLTTRWGMTERAAFRWLQRTAMHHRSSIRAIAQLVIASHPARTATSANGAHGRSGQPRRTG